jgi:hypothetical protein
LEKKGQGEIILAFRNLVLNFMRYYKDTEYTRMEQLTDQELEIKKNVDGNAKAVIFIFFEIPSALYIKIKIIFLLGVL